MSPTLEHLIPWSRLRPPEARAVPAVCPWWAAQAAQACLNGFTPVPGQKNPVLALILTFFFGPLGMLYSTVLGGLVTLVVSGLIGFLTAGLGLFLIWPLQLLWSGLTVRGHNQRLRQQFGQMLAQPRRPVR